MPARIHINAIAAALVGALVLGAAALVGAAFADVLIYANNLKTKRDGKELSHFEGKAKSCARHVRGGSLLIQVTAKDTCGYRLPLEGDRPQPDHSLHARFKLSKKTPKALRAKSYLGLAVRYGGGAGYTLRILPKRHQFKLRRLPKGTGFPVAGKDHAIKATNKWNDVRLEAFGSHVTGVVNGKKVADVNDGAANQVKGRKAEVFAGANKANPVGASARVDDVRLVIPSP
jgi:Domain of Unknown Function (DUF1080)